MGLGGISWPQLLIILVIVLALFGTKRLRNLGSDLGNAIKGFKKAMKEEDGEASKDDSEEDKKLEQEKTAAPQQEKTPEKNQQK